MAIQKTHAVKILTLCLCCILIFGNTITSFAQDIYDEYVDWDGVIGFQMNTYPLYMNSNLFNVMYDFNTDGTATQERNNTGIVTYKGTVSNILTITDLVPKSVIDGQFIVYGEAELYIPIATYVQQVYRPNIVFEADNENHITFGGYTRSWDSSTRTVKFAIEIQFNEYYCTSDFVNIPFNMTFDWGIYYMGAQGGSPNSLNPNVTCFIDMSTDWAGDMKMYTNPQSNPSMDGYFADQNQTIIDQSQTQIDNQVIQNQLQEEQNQLQQDANDLQAESNAQNKNFMDNFFDNLGNTVLHWIVPTSDEMNGFLQAVNTWFSERLGFLWFPFDFAFDMMGYITSFEMNPEITLPPFFFEINGETYQIWEQQSFDITVHPALEEFFFFVRMVNDFILCFAVLNLAVKKWDDWIGGRN